MKARLSATGFLQSCSLFFFFSNDAATTEIYTLSLHDALPICRGAHRRHRPVVETRCGGAREPVRTRRRSEEHTSELQSRRDLVCRLLLEKKKKSGIYRVSSCHKREEVGTGLYAGGQRP